MLAKHWRLSRLEIQNLNKIGRYRRLGPLELKFTPNTIKTLAAIQVNKTAYPKASRRNLYKRWLRQALTELLPKLKSPTQLWLRLTSKSSQTNLTQIKKLVSQLLQNSQLL